MLVKKSISAPRTEFFYNKGTFYKFLVDFFYCHLHCYSSLHILPQHRCELASSLRACVLMKHYSHLQIYCGNHWQGCALCYLLEHTQWGPTLKKNALQPWASGAKNKFGWVLPEKTFTRVDAISCFLVRFNKVKQRPASRMLCTVCKAHYPSLSLRLSHLALLITRLLRV